MELDNFLSSFNKKFSGRRILEGSFAPLRLKEYVRRENDE